MTLVGTMVVCLSCKRVVWAYDADYGDLRGICNCFGLHCFRCGAKGNFDGWRIGEGMKKYFGISDVWSVMHKLAEVEGYEWDTTGDNRWPTQGPDPAFLRKEKGLNG